MSEFELGTQNKLIKYAAVLSYQGADYCGWQKQVRDRENKTQDPKDSKLSVQEVIETTLEKMTQERVPVVASGRTDAGVHATGQVVHLVLKKKKWDTHVLRKGLNALLPQAIKVLHLERVSPSFHAQRSAVKKQYSYYFQQGPAPVPHLYPYSWWIRKKLNLPAMMCAAKALIGEHDFKPFRASGAAPGTTIRRIFEIEISEIRPTFVHCEPSSGIGLQNEAQIELVRVRIVGSGFLKQMVRGIAGTIVQVGENRRSPECFVEILETQDRSKLGPTAPSRALFLDRVWYPDTGLNPPFE